MNESVIFAESIKAMSLARNDNNLLTKSFSQSQILKNNNHTGRDYKTHRDPYHEKPKQKQPIINKSMKQKLLNCLSGGVLRALLLLTVLLMLGLNSYATTGSFIVPTAKDDGANNVWPNQNQYDQTIVSTDNFGGVKWTATAISNNKWGWPQMRCGRSKNASSPSIYSNGAVSYAVNKVILNVEAMKDWKLLNSVKLYVSSASNFTTGTATTVFENPVISKITTSGSEIVSTIPSTASKGDKYAFEFIVNAPVPNQYYKVEINFGIAGENGPFGINKLEFQYEDSADLGAIMYNGTAANGQNLSGNKGDVFTFTATNAEEMALTEGNNIVNGTNSVAWTAPAVTTDTEYTLNIVAKQGANQETATVKVTVKPASLCGEVVFNPASGEIVGGSYVTMTCDGAEQIKYWFNDNQANAVTIDATEAKVQINEACTLHATGINVDGKDGDVSSATYTLKALTADDVVDDMNIDTFGIKGSGYQTKLYTAQLTQVEYCAKAQSSNGLYINSKATTGGVKSGVVSIKNDADLIIDKIEITLNNAADISKLVVMMSNNPGTYNIDDSDNKKSYVLGAEDGIEIENPSNEASTYIYSSDASYKYFAITSTGGVAITHIKVYYQEPAKTPAAPELVESVEVTDGTITGETLAFKPVEGVSVWYKLTIETPLGSPMREPNAQGYTKYTDPVALNSSVKSVSFYAVDDATGAKSAVRTYAVDVESGIAGIEAEVSEAVYYNLQGVRVENPLKGLYIRVVNGKSQKVIL